MVLVGNMSNREAIEFRLATEADLLELRSLYAETVDELGPTAYTPAQVAAWKAFADDPGFDDFILEVHTYVAVSDVQAVGFCGIADDGHVASVYVGPAYCRQGVGSMLLTWALTRPRCRLPVAITAKQARSVFPSSSAAGFDRSVPNKRSGTAWP